MRLPLPNVLTLALVSLILGGCAGGGQIQHSQTERQPAPTYSESNSETAEKLWQVFERYQGTPYQYGGMSGRGFDCSGFINTAYREGLNRRLPRTTGQMLQQGEPVSPENIAPGDIVFFRIKGKEQHAGIYMGDNRFIHASSSVGVTESELNGYYWRNRLSSARRFLPNR
ncbi:NlpC/P60 family protein [Marinobacter nauticus]